MPTQIFKSITSTISNRQETSAAQTVNGSGITYTLCDRTATTDKNANYFASFNLPVLYSSLSSGSTLALSNPEILQINVDKILMIPIEEQYYNEAIDGRSVKIKVPQISGLGMSAKTLVSSTYSTFQKKESNIFLGNNIAFLFCDEINLPYTGTTNGGAVSKSGVTTWDVFPYTSRPPAVPYSDLDSNNDINTDRRPSNSIKYATPVTQAYPTNTNQGYNYDVPCGFICLDKGFIIVTHPLIVNNLPWNQGYQIYSNNINDGVSTLSSTTEIYFNDTSKSEVTFADVNVSFKTSVVCMGLPGEFYYTNNPSWDITKNAQEFTNQTNNYDPVFITEVGLYNRKSELVAVAKLSEPVEKSFTNLIMFNLDVEV